MKTRKNSSLNLVEKSLATNYYSSKHFLFLFLNWLLNLVVVLVVGVYLEMIASEGGSQTFLKYRIGHVDWVRAKHMGEYEGFFCTSHDL